MRIDLLKLAMQEKLTVRQVLLLYFMSKKLISDFKRYKEICEKIGEEHISSIEKDDLVKRKLLVMIKGKLKLNRDLDLFDVDDDLDESVIFSTFYNDYPSFYKDDKGKSLPLKMAPLNLLKGLIKKVITNKEELDEILLDLKYGVENDLVKMRIDNFFIYKQYELIRELRLKEIAVSSLNDKDF